MPFLLNTKADSLVFFASLLLPHPKFKDKKYPIEIVYRASIPDNVESQQVFDDNKSLQLFLENEKSSSEHEFNDDNHESSNVKRKLNQNDEVQL